MTQAAVFRDDFTDRMEKLMVPTAATDNTSGPRTPAPTAPDKLHPAFQHPLDDTLSCKKARMMATTNPHVTPYLDT